MNKIAGLVSFLLAFCVSLTGCASRQHLATEETVKFVSASDTLEGVLNLPGNSGNYPLAVFVHGSGMATRHDYVEFVQPMNRAGIAVFRYDKRGVGASGGVYSNVGAFNSEAMFAILAADATAAIQHFATDKRINARKIILIGGSQAGWIIPEVNKLTTPWLSVCMSGPGVTVGEEIYYSELAEHGAVSQAAADKALPEFKGMRGFDPRSRIATMSHPSLWLFGGKDVSIPVIRSMEVIDSLKSLHHLPLEMKLYPGADHGLFNATRHQREQYVDFIVAWIIKQKR